MQPLISIIIPVYNQSEELVHALGSIEKQTYENLEVIVVDDGSEINVQDVQFEIQFYRQENKGAPSARNKGFEMSKGEYVIFWDADIIGRSDMLEKMFDALKANPDASYSYSDFYFGNKKMPAGKFDAEKLKKINYITTTSLIRRSDFPRLRQGFGGQAGFDESLKKFQDWDLWLALLQEGKRGVYVPGFLFKIKPGGTMSNWLPSFAYKKSWAWLPGVRGKVEKYKKALDIIRKKYPNL